MGKQLLQRDVGFVRASKSRKKVAKFVRQMETPLIHQMHQRSRGRDDFGHGRQIEYFISGHGAGRSCGYGLSVGVDRQIARVAKRLQPDDAPMMSNKENGPGIESRRSMAKACFDVCIQPRKCGDFGRRSGGLQNGAGTVSPR
ncbi:hypothetical protein AA23498_3183 [Acetobacter nitrogenifigens DSM 23921 = NBRC 105050]|nr:hypothetical protein AA23498_3183 [Acetobacter nitrogenifigens DSM 23921 = NBRC 105050]